LKAAIPNAAKYGTYKPQLDKLNDQRKTIRVELDKIKAEL
jgi:hypothetical protein